MFHRKRKLLIIFVAIFIFYVFYILLWSENTNDSAVAKNVKLDLTHDTPINADNEKKDESKVHVDSQNQLTTGGRIKLFDETFNHTINPVDVVKSITYLNEHHEILNSGIGLDKVSIVLIVQVHNRAEYLKLLIDSLEKVKGIEKALIVFSHDIYHPPVNELILNIKFCQVIQIFYPYTIQIFHNRFPGTDPNDCEEKISKAEAERIQCNNWNSSDTYGNYRKAQLTQIKHHFWWKMNYVFDAIMEKYKLSTNVLLLEEDHMVTPDVLHVLNMILATKSAYCPNCSMISLGLFMKNFNYYERDIFKLGKQTWFGKHNTGMVLNKEVWNQFRSCAKMFCEFDDYNWDWSMIQISYKCFPQKIVAIYSKSPRVLHIGDCGVHTHKCNSQNTANKMKALFEKVSKSFFPEKMDLTENLSRVPKISKPNGGWGDVRDHQLCFLNTYPLNTSIWSF
uniref:Alpha-1,6-mannosyl-glycoprotein 2-beta-N-acetylglucosaminyltransferase n=1 Tax=Panagrolaimus sp. JU765 TaxID=591449 RepID=A0AC34RIP0_9BILA